MKTDKPLLFHSAQQLDNSSPDIICEGEKRLDLHKDKEKRQSIVSNIDRVVSSSSSSEDVSSSSKVSIYRNLSEFVVKSIPEERDGYGRRAPILSYGNFPDEEINVDEEVPWVETVSHEIVIFAQSIEITLTKETQKLIQELLEQAVENIHQKKIQKEFGNEFQSFLLSLGVASLVPIVLGWLLHNQIPHMLKPLIQQNPQQILITHCQEILQALVVALTGLVTISNTTLILILKLPSLIMIRRASRTRKKLMIHESKVY